METQTSGSPHPRTLSRPSAFHSEQPLFCPGQSIPQGLPYPPSEGTVVVTVPEDLCDAACAHRILRISPHSLPHSFLTHCSKVTPGSFTQVTDSVQENIALSQQGAQQVLKAGVGGEGWDGAPHSVLNSALRGRQGCIPGTNSQGQRPRPHAMKSGQLLAA